MSEGPTLIVAAALLAVATGSAAGQTGAAAKGAASSAPDRAGHAATETRHVFTRPLMGTVFRIVIAADDSTGARAAAGRAFDRVAELERILSDYDPASELSRLSDAAGTGRQVAVSADLFAVLGEAAAWSARTDGAFDVTVGPLTKLWRRAARRGSVPADDEIEAARAAVGYRLLELDSARRAVRLAASGMRLDAGGIGKGYAADAALAVLAAAGFPAGLVDAGGDVVAGGPPPGEPGWRVALPDAAVPPGARVALPDAAGPPGGRVALSHAERPPGARPALPDPTDAADHAGCTLLLAHAALATSGDRYRGVDAPGGVRHSHILDPRTGRALTHGRTVTVLAPTATEADVLASALSVLAPDAGRSLVATREGAAAWTSAPEGDSPPLSDIPHSSCLPERQWTP